ncbi:winged helix-turn-helix domain-containing protein [Vibrio sp. Of7-15]|uniref:winged helix-turn-helix domain-containing protein n=1 Tax=Vibrio sp. Of7-15 TaxID=2724879 RepID=UPI001EF34BF3|nr:winged helix-turn-helix domain-containing protein [Vibrio sp. Of7-15]MCG7497518.1 winged helix-turn-helix domain-containing protein [Vibrio sp. Of7-15]
MLETSIVIGGFEIVPTEQTITRLSDQKTIRLSKSECLIVRTLAEQPNTTISREYLLTSCWSGKVVTHSSLTVAIKHIRTAFSDIGEPNIIITEPKKGYSLRVPNQATDFTSPLSPRPQSLSSNKPTHSVPRFALWQRDSITAAKRYGVQTGFFFLTLLTLAKYGLFVETTNLNGIPTRYDGMPLPHQIIQSITELDLNATELIIYPLGGLCSSYQVLSVSEQHIQDWTASIPQRDCK